MGLYAHLCDCYSTVETSILLVMFVFVASLMNNNYFGLSCWLHRRFER